MDEAKAAAYYDELSRKGSGAARFKQGLGFSSAPSKPSSTSASSSFLSSFVRASSPSKPSEDLQKQYQIEYIQNKLRKKPRSPSPRRDNERDGDGDRRRSRRERRSRSRSGSRERRGRSRSRDRDRGDYRGGSRRSRSPRGRRRSGKEEKGSAIDYSNLIEGYSEMTPAERVKAKMKFQLKETAKKDIAKGMNSKWERFDFDKDAPLDDEEIEVAEDDALLVKDIGRTFRFSAVQAKREDEVKAAHDQAMFGAPAAPFSQPEEPPEDNDKRESHEIPVKSPLISENLVSAMRQGSWRDRVRRSQEESKG